MRTAISAGESPAMSRSSITWRWSVGSAASAVRRRLEALVGDVVGRHVDGVHLWQRDRALRAQVVERGIARDPQQPGAERRGRRPVVAQGARQPGEDVAGDVLGVVLVADDRQDEP